MNKVIPNQTDLEKALSHVLAHFFKRHESFHDGTIKRNYPCPICEALGDLTVLIGAREDAAHVEGYKRGHIAADIANYNSSQEK